MTRIAVIGCGLIGGSLLRALHAAGAADLLALDADAATRQAIKDALGIDAHAALDEARSADLIVLALPIPALLESFAPLARALDGRRDVIVTDVAGIKAPVLEAARALPDGVTFVGGHPMAGKERGGFGQSDAALFRDRVVALCGADEAIGPVEALWRSTGARTIRCEAIAHDRAVARVSHVPHLVAAALARVAGRGDALSKSLAASGLRDTTRVAEDPTVRFAAARNPAVPGLAREVAAELRAFAEALERGDSVDQPLDEAAAARRAIFPS